MPSKREIKAKIWILKNVRVFLIEGHGGHHGLASVWWWYVLYFLRGIQASGSKDMASTSSYFEPYAVSHSRQGCAKCSYSSCRSVYFAVSCLICF